MHSINLIPKEIINAKKMKRRRLQYVGFFLLALVVCSCVSNYMNLVIKDLDKELKSTEEKILFIQSQLKDAAIEQDIFNQIKIKQNFFDKFSQEKTKNWVDVVKAIGDISNHVLLKTIIINEDDGLIIEGISANMQNIATQLETLKQTAFIKEVKLNYIRNTSKYLNLNIYEFKITCSISRE